MPVRPPLWVQEGLGGVGSAWGRWAQQPTSVADPQISAPSKCSLVGEGVTGAGVTVQIREQRRWPAGVLRGDRGMLCGCVQSHPAGAGGVSRVRVPSVLFAAGSRAPCLLAQGVFPAHQPPPALHPEAGPDPHGEPGGYWGAAGLGQAGLWLPEPHTQLHPEPCPEGCPLTSHAVTEPDKCRISDELLGNVLQFSYDLCGGG